MLKIDIKNAELKEINEIFLKDFEKHALKYRKQQYIRTNNTKYITKAIQNEPRYGFPTNLWEREKMNLILSITNNEISV